MDGRLFIKENHEEKCDGCFCQCLCRCIRTDRIKERAFMSGIKVGDTVTFILTQSNNVYLVMHIQPGK
jgi:hypothetical protein